MQEEQDKLVNEEAAEASVEEAAPTAETAVESSEAPDKAERIPHRKVRQGTVVSNKMQKSIVVSVTRRVRHPLYKKYFYKSKKFVAHDEANDCNIGDVVRIIETRPLSARKRWRLDEIVERAK